MGEFERRGSDSQRTSDIPNLERNVSLADVSYIKPNGRHHLLAPLGSG